jgi:2-methylcitrate dehydratase PrpD
MTSQTPHNPIIGITTFIHDLTWTASPPAVRHQVKRCLLDLIGTLIAGRATPLGNIAYTTATRLFGGTDATLPLDGTRVSAAGAALAVGLTIDAMDAHDGYRPAKGHAGANVFPAALAAAEIAGWSGRDFLTALIVGYEIALRAAVALHQTACDYHSSGAWGALGAAAIFARALGLNREQTRHALGIAEYYGPRSPMMRGVDHPAMLKDGSGWGSMAGVTAAYLAASGFTGAPAHTVEVAAVAPHWASLGRAWWIEDLYFKPYACCRWTHPAIEATRALVRDQALAPGQITRIVVHTFTAATHLTQAAPQTTEEAQYSLPYPVAATLIDGRLDAEQVTPPRIFDADIIALAHKVEVVIDEALDREFPARALAHIDVETGSGQVLSSDVFAARGDPDLPLSDDELIAKFTRLAMPHLSAARRDALRDHIWRCDEADRFARLQALLSPPLDTTGS